MTFRQRLSIVAVLISLLVIFGPMVTWRFMWVPLPTEPSFPSHPEFIDRDFKKVEKIAFPVTKGSDLLSIYKSSEEASAWIIKIADVSNAEELLKTLRSHEIPAFINPDLTDTTTVWVGPVLKRSEIEKMQKAVTSYSTQNNVIEKYNPLLY